MSNHLSDVLSLSTDKWDKSLFCSQCGFWPCLSMESSLFLNVYLNYHQVKKDIFGTKCGFLWRTIHFA